MNNTVGPCLPPHLQSKKDDESDNAKKSIGPALPPWLTNKESDVIGPDLPGSTKEETKGIGPALPPWLSKDNSFGPALPPGYTGDNTVEPELQTRVEEINDDGDDDDEPVIGPLPPSTSDNNVLSIAEEFEQRSKKMKDKLEGRDKPKKLEREEWMTELPPLLQGFGGGARKFRVREKQEIGDRSVWTDTPVEKAKRVAKGKAAKIISDEDRINIEAWAIRDAAIAKNMENESDSKRKESLMDIHDKARKRKLEEDKESGEANIRRPFDRELDLEANKFDEAAKKRFIKKTQGLSSRFSAGATSQKFL